MIQYFLKLIVFLSATLLITHCGDKENILGQVLELVKTSETQTPHKTLEGTPKNLAPSEETPTTQTISNNNSSLDEHDHECEHEHEEIPLIHSSNRAQNDNSNKTQNLLCHVPEGHPESQKTLNLNMEAIQAHLKNHQFDYLGPCQ